MSRFDPTAAAAVYSGRTRIFRSHLEDPRQLVRLRGPIAPRSAPAGSEVAQSQASLRQASEIDRMRDPLTPADVAGALAGEEDALNRLVERLTPVIQSRVASALLRGSASGGLRPQVEDMVQEVFIALFDKGGATLRNWDPERGTSLESFVAVVAERRTISFLRSGRKNPWKEEATLPEELDGLGSDAGSERLTASRELLGEILRRLEAELSPQGWQVFRLLFIEQLSVAEIRRRVDLSADAIYAWRSRLRRLARRLRQEIESERKPKRLRTSSRGRRMMRSISRLIR